MGDHNRPHSKDGGVLDCCWWISGSSGLVVESQWGKGGNWWFAVRVVLGYHFRGLVAYLSG